MIEIGGLLVEESWVEYAVELDSSGAIVECDSRAEAEAWAASGDCTAVQRRCYITGWDAIDG